MFLGLFLLMAFIPFSENSKDNVAKAMDPDPPTAICVDTAWVYPGPGETVILNTADIDDGSYDNCPPLSFAVRRNDLNCDGSIDEFDPTVEFCCGDAGQDITVTLLVVDGEGFFSACESVIQVVDSGPPTAVCEIGILVDIPEVGGPLVLYPEQLDAGSYDDCAETVMDFSFSANEMLDSLVIPCSELYCSSIFTAELWALDQSGNSASCETIVNVSNVGDFCGACSPLVNGVVTNAEGEGLNGVEINITDLGTANTNDLGYYELIPETIPPTLQITPTLDTLADNGVTTFDMVLIRLHILGIQPLDSPYKRIAADANNSESISTLDLVFIQQLILGLSDEYPFNTSWRFVDASYEFPVPEDPWFEAFPETVVIDAFCCDAVGDFIGIKIGDVNNTADPDPG